MTHIFLVAGPPAVGKSTTARALAAKFPKSIHIPVDDVRDMVVSGLVYPGSDWSPDLIEQLALARASVAQMAAAYSTAGFVVAIDDFWDHNSQLSEYRVLFQNPDFHRVLLFPSQRAAEDRNRKRSGPGGENAYLAGGIHLVYEHLQNELPNLERRGWMVVDTTDKSVEATVDTILAQMR